MQKGSETVSVSLRFASKRKKNISENVTPYLDIENPVFVILYTGNAPRKISTEKFLNWFFLPTYGIRYVDYFFF